MDFRDPLRTLFPGVHGAVLSALAATTRPLTLRQLADLADSHPSQVSKHVDRLAQLGVLCRERVGSADQITMCDTAVADLLRQFPALFDTTLDRMRALAADMDPAPANVTVFGSFARRQAGPESDIDLVIVKPASVPDDDAWIDAIGRFTDGVWDLTRNSVADIHVPIEELTDAFARPLWQEILRDGITLVGQPLKDLRP